MLKYQALVFSMFDEKNASCFIMKMTLDFYFFILNERRTRGAHAECSVWFKIREKSIWPSRVRIIDGRDRESERNEKKDKESDRPESLEEKRE